MLKKKLIILLFLFVAFNKLTIQAEEIPSKFFIRQHWISLTHTFDILSKDLPMGTVHRKHIKEGASHYLFYDAHNKLQAKAYMSFFDWGASLDIYDGDEQLLGKVEEKIVHFFPIFDLYRADGYHAASAKINLCGTKYTVIDPATHQVFAYLWRHFFSLKDDWTVEILDPTLFREQAIDYRLLILMLTFQIDHYHWQNMNPNSSL